MPKYIGYTPQFNPISLQEYLAVPMMLQQEFDTYEEKYNENLDKLAAMEGMLDDSIKDYLNPYKGQLNNAADIISGKTGDLNSLRQQTSAARQFYREFAPRLTNAYNKRQAALKAQQELLLKDPSAVTTKIGNMRSYLDNPDQVFQGISGDKVYADSVAAGQMAAKDISNIEKAGAPGYIAQRTGYTLDEQYTYKNAVLRALSGDPTKYKEYGNKTAEEYLSTTAKYAQPYQVLSKYIEDNKFNLYDPSEQSYLLNRALSGQLMGMAGDVKYIEDKAWAYQKELDKIDYSLRAKAKAQTQAQEEEKDKWFKQDRGIWAFQTDEKKQNTYNKLKETKNYKKNGKTEVMTGFQATKELLALEQMQKISKEYEKLNKKLVEANKNGNIKEAEKVKKEIKDFDTRYKNFQYVKTKDDRDKLEKRIQIHKNMFGDIIASEKEMNDMGIEGWRNMDYDTYNKALGPITYNTKLTTLNATNTAGNHLKDDLFGGLSRSIKLNKKKENTEVKTLDGRSIKLFDNKEGKSLLTRDKDGNYSAEAVHVNTEGIRTGSLIVQSDHEFKKGDINAAYIPVEYFGTEVENAFKLLYEAYLGTQNPTQAQKDALAAKCEEDPEAGVIITNTLTHLINTQKGYNTFQYLGNTKKEE